MGRYLDEVQRQNLEYIEALGQADTAVKKAGAIAKLLPERREESKRQGVLDRMKLTNQAIRERQTSQSSGTPVPAQDEQVMSMAPAPQQVAGSSGLGTGGGANDGVALLQQVFGGGGPQPASQRGAGQPASAPRPGQRAVTSTSTSTTPARAPSSPVGMLMRLLDPKSGQPRTSTITKTITQRDPEVFQTNITGVAAGMDAARISGNQTQLRQQLEELKSTYGPEYAMQVAQMAKVTDQTAQMARLRQVPGLARELSVEYDLSGSESMAAARALAGGNYDTYQKLLGERKPTALKEANARLRASNAQVRASDAQAVLAKEKALTERATREQAISAINAEHLDTTLLGFSLADSFEGQASGASGQVTGKDFFKQLDNYIDDDGNLKESAKPQAQGAQHWLLRRGGLLLFDTKPTGAIERFQSLWSNKNNSNIAVGLDEVTGLVQAQNTDALEALNLGRLEGSKWIWAYQDDRLHPNADPSRAVHNYLIRSQRLGSDFPIETRRGAARLVQEATTPEPAPEPAPPAPTAAPAQANQSEEMLSGPLGRSLKDLAKRWWKYQAAEQKRQHQALQKLRKQTGRP